MNSLAALLVPLTFLLPVGGGEASLGEHPVELTEKHVSSAKDVDEAYVGNRIPWVQIALPFDIGPAYQVRLERRVILRVSPRRTPIRRNLAATLPPTTRAPRFIETEMDECVSVSGIAAVQPARGSRLLFHMRDRTLVAADLEKSCSSSHFYSGFYVESNEDGRICIDRDKLQSRSGAKCQLSDMNRLVRVEDQ